MADPIPVQRPTPQRPCQLTPASTESSGPPTPSPETENTFHLDSKASPGHPPSRNRSIMNLTSSTLFGIYAPTGYEAAREGSATPWGTGSQTPVKKKSVDDLKPSVIGPYERPRQDRTQSIHHWKPRNVIFPLALRTALLFLFGIAYGVIITHLHDNRALAPVQVEGINRNSWRYLVFWGLAGIALGSLLPWVDVVWENTSGEPRSTRDKQEVIDKEPRTESDNYNDSTTSLGRSGSGLGAEWIPVVRSIGAFVGIAFAIRKLPWQSTFQVSFTLALVNPVLWYLIDRSKPGFILSAFIGITGTTVLLGVNPHMVPSPAMPSPPANAMNVSYENLVGKRLISNESVGVGTWIASVLFCSCVCFGNIGRKLALGNAGGRESIS